MFEWTNKNLGPVHILINNAGRLVESSLTNGKTGDWKKVLDLNVLGLSICTREAVKIMKAHNIKGHIIHINSVLRHNVFMGAVMNMYVASKFVVTALTQILRLELNSLNLKITSVSPGLVETEGTTLSKDLPPERKAVLKKMPIFNSEDIADGVVYTLSTPEHVLVNFSTIFNKIIIFSNFDCIRFTNLR